MGVSRRTLLALSVGALAGCAGGSDPGTEDASTTEAGTPTEGVETPTGTADPTVTATPRGDLELSSPAFEDGGAIPPRYSRDGENVNPPLRVSGVPGATASFVLIVDDPDAPGGTFLHWLVWNVDPARREIPEGWAAEDAVVGENDFGNRRYDGPDPPEGEHTYRFRCHALESALDLPPTVSRGDVEAAMDGRVLATAHLEGTYSAR